MRSRSSPELFQRCGQYYAWQMILYFVSLGGLLLGTRPVYAAPNYVPAADPATSYKVLAKPHGLQTVTDGLAPQIAMDSNGSRVVIAWTDLTAADKANVYVQVVDTNLLTVTNVITVATDVPFATGQIVHGMRGLMTPGVLPLSMTIL
ncbi:hypothetical protein BH10CHL1_BH10CHL1_12320 [soil metagenome]